MPTNDGKCLVVVRVEDGTLSEIESVLADQFKVFVKPHSTLPAGSVILIGSQLHPCSLGNADWAEAQVGVSASIRNKFGGSIEILPSVPVPMHGVDSPALVRALLDFDAKCRWEYLTASETCLGGQLRFYHRFWY